MKLIQTLLDTSYVHEFGQEYYNVRCATYNVHGSIKLSTLEPIYEEGRKGIYLTVWQNENEATAKEANMHLCSLGNHHSDLNRNPTP